MVVSADMGAESAATSAVHKPKKSQPTVDEVTTFAAAAAAAKTVAASDGASEEQHQHQQRLQPHSRNPSLWSRLLQKVQWWRGAAAAADPSHESEACSPSSS